MAEFCSKCVEELELPVVDIDVNEIFNTLKDNCIQNCLCEGCGLRAIGRINGELKVIRFLEEDENQSWR